MDDKRLKILVIDDDQSMREFLVTILKDKYTVSTASSGSAGLRLLDQENIDIVLLDLKLPDINGLDVLKVIKDKYAQVEVMVISILKDIDVVVSAMKLGAYNYVTKDIDPDELLTLVDRLRDRIECYKERCYLRSEVEQLSTTEIIIGQSVVMRQIYETLSKIAQLPSTILLLGDTGTGKKVMARHIHKMSNLSDKPFVTVDLSAIPENLMESTLFGHEKGAFTGAVRQRYGKVELADGGTLFLDEIGCLKYDIQSKLLRLIQDKEIERVGSNKTVKVNVRLIVATNADLSDAVKKGSFREDLYYRINVVPVKLPPLRERTEDIPELIRYFMDKFSKSFRKDVNKITDSALTILMNYKWPGNIRELENLMERLVAIADSSFISQEDIPVDYYINEKVKAETEDGLLDRACKTFERNFILKTLEQERWSRTKTANTLGIPISTLKYKFNRLEIYNVLAQKKKLSRRSRIIRGGANA
ncbi:MAG: sigma-54-dependent Fis family transcriptional regulator [Nitrospirae bacterium]|nr:sigma-54-dependent Fis family transcriptional regulator [Nitrospirota bacterium]